MKHIQSIHNPIAVHVRRLHKKNYRYRHGEFIVEGIREIRQAIAGGFRIVRILFAPELGDFSEGVSNLPSNTISADLYRKLAYRGGSEGVLGVFKTEKSTLEKILSVKGFLGVAAIDLEKPGNLGAIARTMAAINGNGIMMIGKSVDIYNPNAIRSSIGGIFRVPTIDCTLEELMDACDGKNIQLLAADPSASYPYTEGMYSKPTLFLLGNEAHGFAMHPKAKAIEKVHIPVPGMVDSLNVSVAAAVLLYEAVRQRCAPL